MSYTHFTGQPTLPLYRAQTVLLPTGKDRYGGEAPAQTRKEGVGYSILMFAACTTLRQRAISLAIWRAKRSGEPPIASPPSVASRSATSGERAARVRSLY